MDQSLVRTDFKTTQNTKKLAVKTLFKQTVNIFGRTVEAAVHSSFENQLPTKK